MLLRTIIDLVPDSIYAKDLHMRKTLANRVDVMYMGLQSEDEALGKTDAEIYAWQGDFATAIEHDRQVLESGQPVLNREEQILIDGGWRWLLTSKVPLRTAEGELIGLVGVGRDITERKLSENTMRELNQILEARVTERTLELQAERDLARQVMESMGQGLVLYDLQGKGEYYNPAVFQILGYSPEDVLTKGLFDVVLPEDHEIVREGLAQRLQGQAGSYEVHMLAADGSIRDILLTATPRWRNGQVMGGAVVMTDLTERKQAEQKLRKQYNTLAALHQVALDLLNRRDVDELLQTILNRAAELLDAPFGVLALPQDAGLEVRVATPSMHHMIGDLTGFDEGIAGKAFTTRQPQMVDHYSSWPDGVARYVQLGMTSALSMPILTAEEPRGVLTLWRQEAERPFTPEQLQTTMLFGQLAAVALDNAQLYAEARRELAERTQAEAALRRAKDAAEAATRAKSAFLASMSHEIRTPMNGMIGMTELLLRTPDISPEQRYFAETIRSSGHILLTIINDILDFSKIEAGKLELEYYPFQVRECVESVLEMLSFQAAQKHLELVCLIDLAVPEMVMGDSVRLRQVLVNLVGNAIKFTESGEVLVRVTVQDCLPEVNDENPLTCILNFEVCDTGIGIPPTQLEHLFDSFSQLDASTTRKYGGTGLGLAISRNLVEMMGGEIHAQSQGVAGKGSVFSFTIRVDLVEHAAKPKPSWADLSGLRGKKLLLVEVNSMQRRALCELGEAWGLQMQVFKGEAAARDAAQRASQQGAPFDVAVVDMGSPEQSLELTVNLRQASSNLPVILLTTLIERSPDERDNQVAAFINKPMRASRLYDTLAQLIAGPASARVQGQAESDLETGLAERLPLRILLAEDNQVNQELALFMLKMMGYSADLAQNGLQVLEKQRNQPYDVILLDIQMPEMDGMTAARHIVQEWPVERRPYLIALTASATREQRDECLAAGMSAFISKPISVKELRRNLESAAQFRQSIGSVPPVMEEKTEESAAMVSEPLIDWKLLEGYAAMQRPDGQNTAVVVVDLFLEELPETLAALRAAVVNRASADLKAQAHSLKGASRAVGAVRLANLCSRLEEYGRAESLQDAEPLLEELDKLAGVTRQALRLGMEKNR